jgi:predicted amidohydrolase YtcJ
VDLRGCLSIAEVIDRLEKHYNVYKPAFLVGDGWDQTLWENKDLPSNDLLNRSFPDIPVYLRRVDFHALWVNERAIELAGLRPGDSGIAPGEAILTADGHFTGVFLENTYERINATIPPMTDRALTECILEAQALCFSYGLGSVSDAGLLWGKYSAGFTAESRQLENSNGHLDESFGRKFHEVYPAL